MLVLAMDTKFHQEIILKTAINANLRIGKFKLQKKESSSWNIKTNTNNLN